MTIYYFNIYNDDNTLDEEGGEFADPHAARAFAIKAARGLAAATAQLGHLVLSHRIEIVDADQQPVDIVTFGDAVLVSD